MITIVAIGTKIPAWVEEGIAHYTKQLRNITIHTLKNSTKEKEGKEILKYLIKQENYCVVLDETGVNYSSYEFAKHMNSWSDDYKHIIFVIGGAFGIATEVKQHAHSILSLSKATMPHSLARLILIEQIYRAHTITKNHPYHKE